MYSRYLLKHISRAFILSIVFKMILCVPVSDKTKGDKKEKKGIFDIILNVNSQRNAGHPGDGIVGSISDSIELFQGDIVMTKNIKKALKEGGTDEMDFKPERRRKRATSSDDVKKWPVVKGLREVPYVIESSIKDPVKKVIEDAIKHWTTNVPCITFVQRTNQKDYISFFAGDGCFSWTGRIGRKQRVSIGSGCEFMGIAAHEIGHVLGFWHEQSRPDRDNYVTILWNNIKPGKELEFKKIINGGTDDLGVAYDYNSLMHYGAKDFSKSASLNTMVKPDGSTDFGKATALSPKDIEQARLMYCPGTNTCASFYKDNHQDCQSWARLGYCKNKSYKGYMDINCKKSCVCGIM